MWLNLQFADLSLSLSLSFSHFPSQNSDPSRQKWFHVQFVFDMSWISFYSRFFWSKTRRKDPESELKPLIWKINSLKWLADPSIWNMNSSKWLAPSLILTTAPHDLIGTYTSNISFNYAPGFLLPGEQLEDRLRRPTPVPIPRPNTAQKWSFALSISLVNLTKSAVFLNGKLHFLCILKGLLPLLTWKTYT